MKTGMVSPTWDGDKKLHTGGCQNYGLLLDPYYNTVPNI